MGTWETKPALTAPVKRDAPRTRGRARHQNGGSGEPRTDAGPSRRWAEQLSVGPLCGGAARAGLPRTPHAPSPRPEACSLLPCDKVGHSRLYPRGNVTQVEDASGWEQHLRV